jgi:hypothetical protein
MIKKIKILIGIILSVLIICLASIGIWYSIIVSIQRDDSIKVPIELDVQVTIMFNGTIQVDNQNNIEIHNTTSDMMWGWTNEYGVEIMKGKHEFKITNQDTGKQDSAFFDIYEKKYVWIGIYHDDVVFQLSNIHPLYM